MQDKLIKHNDYQLKRVFDSIDDLKSMLFQDIINASLHAFNSLTLRSIIDLERIIMNKHKHIYNKDLMLHVNNARSSSNNPRLSGFVFCEMFYELNDITKCKDFNVLFLDCFREYIQFWLNDLLCVDILKINGDNNNILNDDNAIKKKLRYIVIMNSIIANYDNLIKFKLDVENGKIEKLKNILGLNDNPNDDDTNVMNMDIKTWDTKKLCTFMNNFSEPLANQLSKLHIDGAQIVKYDYNDILFLTQLHPYYLPPQIWNYIASQLALPCVTDEKFIRNKRKERKKLEKKQNKILSNIDRLHQKTKAS